MSQQQPTWTQIEAAFQSVIETAAGIPAYWAYQNANAPTNRYVRLTLGALITTGIDFIDERAVPDWAASTAYAVGDRVSNDDDKTYRCTTAGTSAASPATGPSGTGATIADGTVVWAYVSEAAGIVLTTVGTREVALQLECFTGPAAGSVAPAAGLVEALGSTARAVLDEVVTRLRLPTARDALAAVGVVPFDPGPVNWIPEVAATTYRGRASCDIRCRMPARALREYSNFIESIAGTATIEGGPAGVNITAAFEAP